MLFNGYSIWTSSWLFPYVTIASVYNPEYFSFYLKNRHIKPKLMFQASQKILNLLQSHKEFLKVVN